MRYAAIDIGSNAVRLLIADINESNGSVSFKKNTLIRVPLRLGDDAFLHQYISEKKAVDLVKTMAAFKNLMEVYKVNNYRACATSAMREAKNGPDIVRTIKTEADIDLVQDGQRIVPLGKGAVAGGCFVQQARFSLKPGRYLLQLSSSRLPVLSLLVERTQK